MLTFTRNDNHPHYKEKAREVTQLKSLIEKQKPFSVIIAANSMKARDLERCLIEIVADINKDNPDFKCIVELRDPQVPKVCLFSPCILIKVSFA